MSFLESLRKAERQGRASRDQRFAESKIRQETEERKKREETQRLEQMADKYIVPLLSDVNKALANNKGVIETSNGPGYVGRQLIWDKENEYSGTYKKVGGEVDEEENITLTFGRYGKSHPVNINEEDWREQLEEHLTQGILESKHKISPPHPGYDMST